MQLTVEKQKEEESEKMVVRSRGSCLRFLFGEEREGKQKGEEEGSTARGSFSLETKNVGDVWWSGWISRPFIDVLLP
ncbi:hypothetical protein HAX54_030738 [Datura stramonium]|uniref:Uncharacterized protein n=1 Tax=Datura stramonium TaxID=4076 RepID=A0ABS8VAG0_DATST|nr:hypothetical protein [Datura stramonium]